MAAYFSFSISASDILKTALIVASFYSEEYMSMYEVILINLIFRYSLQ